ncbi:hypothetical protein vseg_013857 [Gypsophila vaccaria]
MQTIAMDNSNSIVTSSSSRWIATVASIWIQAIMGVTYAFSIYSPVLKSSQSYDQSTLDTVSVFKDIGGNAGVISGLLYAAVASATHRWYGGPWFVLALGAAQGFLGYFFMWLSVVGYIPPLPVPVMCFLMFIAAHSQTFFSTANVVTGVLNFPDYSGTIVGILKGCLGLTGAILIQIYQTFFKGKPATFILLIALLPSTVTLALMFLVKISPGSREHDKKHLNDFSIVTVVVAAYLMVLIILENIFDFPQWVYYITLVGLVILLLSPLKIAVNAISNEKSHNQANSTEIEKFVADKDDDYKRLPGSSLDVIPAGESMNIIEALKSVNFWLLFVSMACGMGSGLATVNNLSQIGQSLGYATSKVNSLVSLWSIWNFLGRFGAGFVSDILLRQRGWPRPALMAITLATMSAGHVIIASGFPGNLYIGTVLVGICYGSQWSLMPTVTSEIFGVLHMGTIFNTIAVASPVGTYVLSVWVIGHIYDQEAGEGNVCFGTHCFMVSFFILASVSFLGFLVVLTLFFRTRAYYKSVVLKRLRFY